MKPSLVRPHPECVVLDDGRCVELGRVLGKGSGSMVYRATVESAHGLRRAVALKLFSAVASDEAEHVFAAVVQAARRTARVRHPNVVDVFDCGLCYGQPFLVSELVEGPSLHDLALRYAQGRRRLPLELALFIVCEAAEGLAGARTARDDDGLQLGMTHLGLSPRELLLSWRGEVKVEGFELGLARAASSAVRSLHSVASRANMMSPEIAQGEPGDARSDVFALGVMLRELLVGPRFPPGLKNAEALRLAREGYIHPVSFQPHLSDGLVYVLLRALAVDPDERYPNVSAMLFDLRRVALAMGVGDARYFLRRALLREWGRDGDENTQERTFG